MSTFGEMIRHLCLTLLLRSMCVSFPAWAAAPGDADAPTARYQIGAGDTLTVQVYGEPQLSGAFPVGASGELDFPLLGAMGVTGLTTSEVAEGLHARLSPTYLAHPNVSVWVSAWRSQPVQVLGAVARPGTAFLRGPTTVLQVLGEVGGVTGPGVAEVRVTRAAGGEVLVLPFDRLLELDGELTLAAGDVIYVPQSVVAILGQVGTPGEIGWRDGLTVSQSIASAGGALPTADLGRVFILRGEERIRVNVRRVLAGRDPDVTLRSGDRVFVRESPV